VIQVAKHGHEVLENELIFLISVSHEIKLIEKAREESELYECTLGAVHGLKYHGTLIDIHFQVELFT